MRKGLKKALAVFLILLMVCIVYTIYDNNRVVVEKQEISIDNLPEEFEQFAILQISDLHGKWFGKDQNRLLDLIDSLEYDVVLFTGDMNKGFLSDMQSSEAVFCIIDALAEREKPMYWVDGNAGPYALETERFSRGNLTEIGLLIQDKGCIVLDEPEAIRRGDAVIWLTPRISLQHLNESYGEHILSGYSEEKRQAVLAFRDKLLGWYNQLNNNDQVKIAVTHYPVQRYLSEITWPKLQELDYDLIISGHNHGGQIRIPGYGAIYIPSFSSERGGYFPDQADVKGLSEICGIPQYISAGLGASDIYPLLAFRFFNTPEINLIILTCNSD